MTPLTRYGLFLVLLLVVVGAALNPERVYLSALTGEAGAGRHAAKDVPPIALAPAHVLSGVLGANAIDESADGDLTATGGEGRLTLRRLPDETPVTEIATGDGVQIVQVKFVPGSGMVAGSGQMADGRGTVRMFDVATGKQTRRIDQEEPVVFMDFDRTGRYVVLTALSTIKVWDLVDNQAVSVVNKENPDATGVFFLDDKYVLQSAPVSLYEWKARKRAGGLDDIGAIEVKKINGDLYAWLGTSGLHTLRSPYGRREFIPFDARGITAFDLAPDGRWGLFLTSSKAMMLVDCATGRTVQTVSFKDQPAGVSVSRDGASAFVQYAAGNVEVFEVGNENVFRKVRFHTSRLFATLWNQVGELAKRRPWASAPAN